MYKPEEGARVAISFAFATEAFEPPYFDTSHLPLPPAQVRAGLISALAIYYVQNENPGQYVQQFMTHPLRFLSTRGH